MSLTSGLEYAMNRMHSLSRDYVCGNFPKRKTKRRMKKVKNHFSSRANKKKTTSRVEGEKNV
jgi:hypothetical protein